LPSFSNAAPSTPSSGTWDRGDATLDSYPSTNTHHPRVTLPAPMKQDKPPKNRDRTTPGMALPCMGRVRRANSAPEKRRRRPAIAMLDAAKTASRSPIRPHAPLPAPCLQETAPQRLPSAPDREAIYYPSDRWIEKLAAEPMLLRTPLARCGNELTLGPAEETWRTWV